MPSIVLAPIHAHLLKTWTVLAHDALQHANTGSTTENTLASFSIPGGTIGPNGVLRISSLWSCNNNANSKTPRVKFGGVGFHEVPLTTSLGLQIQTIIRNRNSQAIQVGGALSQAGFGVSTVALVTATIDTTAAQTFAFTAQLASSGDNLNLESYMVELAYGA